MSWWKRRRARKLAEREAKAIAQTEGKSWEEAVTIIANFWIKEIKYTPERVNYQQKPHETRERMKGDCEDIAVMFWWVLKALNLFDQAWIHYGSDNELGEGHAILQVDKDDKTLWLCCARGVLTTKPDFKTNKTRSDWFLTMWEGAK